MKIVGVFGSLAAGWLCAAATASEPPLTTDLDSGSDAASQDAELFTAALGTWETAEPVAKELSLSLRSGRAVSATTPPKKLAAGKMDARARGNLEWRDASVLHSACASGDARTVRFLLDEASKWGPVPGSEAPGASYPAGGDGEGNGKGKGGYKYIRKGSRKGQLTRKSSKRYLKNLLHARFDVKGPLMLTHANIFHALALHEGTAEAVEMVREALGFNVARELINEASGEGYDPLMVAADLGHDRTLDAMFDVGAAVHRDERKLRGLSKGFPMHPIHVAATNGHIEAVAKLLSRGASVNERAFSGRGDTPLHGAAQGGHEDLVEALLDLGADVKAESADGRTAIDLAHEKGHSSIVDLLREHGAPDPKPDPHAFSPDELAGIKNAHERKDKGANTIATGMESGVHHLLVDTNGDDITVRSAADEL